MKKYISIPLFISSAFFAANAFADQLKFSSATVASNVAGSTAPAATMQPTSGTPITTVVVLPSNMAVKDLKTGDVVYLPLPLNSVFRVLNVTTAPDGSLVVDVQDTMLSVGKPMPSMPGMPSSAPMAPASTTTLPTPAPTKNGGY